MRSVNHQSVGYALMLAGMAMIPAFSIDTALPAFLQTAEALHTNVGSIALTLSFFMAGFALGPIIIGPLADSYGRRPLLVTGLAIYIVASAGCSFSSSLGTLLAWRLAQGAGASAGRVLSMAIICDLYKGAQAKARLSYINLIFGIAPMIAPIIGSCILSLSGWRWIYGALTAGGGVLALACWYGYAETAPAIGRNKLSLLALGRGYWQVLSHRTSIGYTLIGAFCFGCIFTYISGSSLLIMGVFKLTPNLYTVAFGCTAFAVMIGSFLTAYLSARPRYANRLLGIGLALSVISSAVMIPIITMGLASLATLLPSLFLCCLACGLVLPDAAHRAIEPLPHNTGTASAVFSSVQMIGGASASCIFGLYSTNNPQLSLAVIMTGSSCCALGIYVFVVSPPSKMTEPEPTSATASYNGVKNGSLS